jgi:hypothetical protein
METKKKEKLIKELQKQIKKLNKLLIKLIESNSQTYL